MIHFDSSFLIDLMRETAREKPGPAFDFIESLDPKELLAISVHVACELRVGAEFARHALKEHEQLDEFLSAFAVVQTDDRFAPMFARVAVATRRAGTQVPPLDLLIATSALLDDAPLVTKHVKDFSRVPGLRVLRY